jgi:hypothetical protein
MMLNYQDQVFEWDDMSVPMLITYQAVIEVESHNEANDKLELFVLHWDIDAVLLKDLTRMQQSQLFQALVEVNKVFLPDVLLVLGAPIEMQFCIVWYTER